MVSYVAIAIKAAHPVTRKYHERFLGCQELSQNTLQLCKVQHLHEIIFTRSTALAY
jgi:hypothetical protein